MQAVDQLGVGCKVEAPGLKIQSRQAKAGLLYAIKQTPARNATDEPARQQAVSTAGRILMHIGVPGSRHRNPHPVSHQRTQHAYVARSGDVHHIGRKAAQLIADLRIITAEGHVESQIFFQWKR